MKITIPQFNTTFLSAYEQQKDLINTHTPYLAEQREQVYQLFKDGLTIPDKTHEDYQHMDMSKAFDNTYGIYYAPVKAPKVTDELCDIFEDDEAHTVMMVNGWIQGDLTKLPSGVILGSLIQAYTAYPDLVKPYLEKHIVNHAEPLSALNTLFAQDGFFVYVPKNVVLKEVVKLVNMVSATETLLVSPRSMVVVEEGASAKILLCEQSIFPADFVNNSLIAVLAEEASHVEFNRLQDTHNASYQLTTTYIHQAKDSVVKANTITLHGGAVRNNLFTTLAGEGAHHDMLGLFLVDKGQHVDNFTFIKHATPHCNSRERYNGILDDFSTGAFAGRILVEKDSQKTNALQSNHNILLTGDARMYTKPQLEIYADDVKCSHGAVVGQLNEEALFYLRQRGIYKKEARLLLLSAFADEIVSEISIEKLRDEVQTLVHRRLSGDWSRCNKCKLKC